MPHFVQTLAGCALTAVVATPAAAQEPAPAARGGDPEVIDFIYPGKFAKALEQAKATNRCLIIKGVAFGVDAAGAECATKGHW